MPTIFITGNSRSGTTMMSRILGNHNDVFAFQELHFFDEILPPSTPETISGKEKSIHVYATLLAIQRNGYFGSRGTAAFADEARTKLNDGKEHSIIELYKQFLNDESKLNNKTIPCEQTPQNIFSIESILKHFPDARIIVMVRDPRAVLFSQKYKWKRRELSGGAIPFREMIRSRINYHPIIISKIWKSVMSEAGKFQNHSQILTVRYEDLLSDAENLIKRVCVFSGVSYDSKMLDIPTVGSSAASDAGSQRGIDSTKKAQWQNGGLTEAEIRICQEINSELMSVYGYENIDVSPSQASLLFQKISFPFRIILAALFNLKRLKDPAGAIKKLMN